MTETKKKTATPTSKRPPASGQHEKMMAGRAQATTVRRYLEALKAERAPKKRGRRRTPDQLRQRIDEIEAQLNNGVTDPLKELELRHNRMLLVDELQAITPKVKSSDYEDEFCKVAKAFGERKHYSYDIWREQGVPVPILRKAGISR